MPSILIEPIYQNVLHYFGEPNLPHDIRNFRISTSETLRRVGTPVLLKRRYTWEDVENGDAEEAPTWDDTYDASTNAQDELSYGIGLWSVQKQDGEWYDPRTNKLYISATIPDPSYRPAARYRGYGPGFLTYAVLPDLPEDVWKLNPEGALVRQQTARAQLPWWPQVGDTDLLITCLLDAAGNIAETYERYELKQVAPITIRGDSDRRGYREIVTVNASGNRWWVGQQCEIVKIPINLPPYNVETDR